MGSPSVEINDVNHVWIYILSLKEENVFEEDTLLFQNIYRFVFDQNDLLLNKTILDADDFIKQHLYQKLQRLRDAYGQLTNYMMHLPGVNNL